MGEPRIETVIICSAGAEFRAILPHFPQADVKNSPVGEYFISEINAETVVFLHGGWGKISAAASCQYAIDHWQPKRIINLATCGGFAGKIKQGEVLLPTKVIVYDIIDQMTDAQQAIDKMSTSFELNWLPTPPPQPVITGVLASADRDLLPSDIPGLIEKYQAIAGDWESGAIAWVCRKNGTSCLILRAVTDVVGTESSDAYANYAYFESQTKIVMKNLLDHLPQWLACFG